MAEIATNNSAQNLEEAFAGESQANRKYLAFAQRADQEGHPQIARLFRAAAEAETVHALAHLRALGGIGSTADNLKSALAGETHEFMSMYPAMIATAAAEGREAALRSFTFANAVEKIHAELYRQALLALGDNTRVDYHVCQVCGNTVTGAPTGPCSVCGAGAAAFHPID